MMPKGKRLFNEAENKLNGIDDHLLKLEFSYVEAKRLQNELALIEILLSF